VEIFIFYNYIASYEGELLEVKVGGNYRKHKKKTGKGMPRSGKN
jgi:hypothetical protein